MKKIIVVLLMLALVAPVLATTLTATQISGTEVKISYDASGDPFLVRAFGIDVVINSPDVTFSEANDISTDYWIFPGTITVSGGTVSNPGTPVAEPSDSPDTQPGLDSNGVTLEMASLYESGEPTPGTTGDLLVLAVNVNLVTGPNIVSVTMSDNGARGGIVLEDGSKGSTYNGTGLYLSTLNRTEYAKWLAWGGGNPANAPQNWRGYCWKCGDVNGDGLLTVGDIVTVYGNLKPASGVGLGDWNMDGLETVGDLVDVYSAIKNTYGTGPCPSTCP
jgi:hypothetical protein